MSETSSAFGPSHADLVTRVAVGLHARHGCPGGICEGPDFGEWLIAACVLDERDYVTATRDTAVWALADVLSKTADVSPCGDGT